MTPNPTQPAASDPTQPTTLSEDAAADGPLTDDALRLALDELSPGIRIEETIAQLGLAAYSVAFARIAAPRLQIARDQIGKQPAGAGLDHLVASILQKAVLDTAAMIDQTGEGSSSLATALNLLTRHLKASPPSSERRAALALVQGIRHSAIENKTPELEYVRYLRNKWAAHVTLDRSVDPWEPGKSLDFAKLETALQQMQSHFHEMATLIQQVTALEALEHDGRKLSENSYRVGIAWEGFSSQALFLMGSHGENSARCLLERLEPGLTADEHESPER